MPPFGSRLRVLPAGPKPPNPSELIGSKRMSALLGELTELADVVVIDTTPLLVVSDAFPLLEQVSGTVGIARLDHTPRDAIQRMVEITTTAGGRVFGMVATGAKGGSLRGYDYGYGYDSEIPVVGARSSGGGNGSAPPAGTGKARTGEESGKPAPAAVPDGGAGGADSSSRARKWRGRFGRRSESEAEGDGAERKPDATKGSTEAGEEVNGAGDGAARDPETDPSEVK